MINLFRVFMHQDTPKQVSDVLMSGYIGEGEKVKIFEQELDKLLNRERQNRILTLNSGTAGLWLAYQMSINQDKNAEIITTPITCMATNTPIIGNGAKLVWADVDSHTGSICPKSVESLITKNTKAIVIVHWGGNPCDIDEFVRISKKYNVKLVQDGAHSILTEYKGKHFSEYGDFSMLSFQAIKHLTTIDGGALICNDEEYYKRGKLLRWYGIDREIKNGIDLRCELDVSEIGGKWHMNDVCATVGLSNLPHVKELVDKTRQNAYYYNYRFNRENKNIRIVEENPDGKSSFWIYTLNVENRDELLLKLKDAGIMASKIHARNDTHSAFKDCYRELPGVEEFNRTHIAIPVGGWLEANELEYVADMTIKYAK